MTRTRLLNKYRKDNSAGNLFFYKRQVKIKARISSQCEENNQQQKILANYQAKFY